jgi:hypothetical protein
LARQSNILPKNKENQTKEEDHLRTRVLSALVFLLALVVPMPAAAQTKLNFAHMYGTSEVFHAEAAGMVMYQPSLFSG